MHHRADILRARAWGHYDMRRCATLRHTLRKYYQSTGKAHAKVLQNLVECQPAWDAFPGESMELCYEAALLHLWRMDLPAAASAAGKARALGKDMPHLDALLSRDGSATKEAADAQAAALLAEGWLPTVSLPSSFNISGTWLCMDQSGKGCAPCIPS